MMVRLNTTLHPLLSVEVVKSLFQNCIITLEDFLKESASKLSAITKQPFKDIISLQQFFIGKYGAKAVCAKHLYVLHVVGVEYLPSGFRSLDDSLGGGLPKRKVIEVCGLTGSGKSLLCHKIAMNVTRSSDSRVVYFDTKGDFTVALMMKLFENEGDDLSSLLKRIIVVRTWTIYDLLNWLHNLRRKVEDWDISLFIVDSLPALMMQFQADAYKETGLGLLNEFVNISRYLCNVKDCPMLVVNIQTRWVEFIEIEDAEDCRNEPAWSEKRNRCLGKYWQHIPSIVIKINEFSDMILRVVIENNHNTNIACEIKLQC